MPSLTGVDGDGRSTALVATGVDGDGRSGRGEDGDGGGDEQQISARGEDGDGCGDEQQISAPLDAVPMARRDLSRLGCGGLAPGGMR